MKWTNALHALHVVRKNFQCIQSRSKCEFRERQTLSSFSSVQYVGESGCRWIGKGESRLWFEVWGKNFNTQQLNCPKVIVLEQTSSEISSVMFYWSFRWNICNQNLVKLKENIKWYQKNISCGWSLFSLFNCRKSLKLLCTNTVYLFFFIFTLHCFSLIQWTWICSFQISRTSLCSC